MRILIVEDHALLREAFGALLQHLARDVELLQASDARGAYRLLEREGARLDLLLLDLQLPDAAPFALLESCRCNHPQVPVIVVSARESRADVERAFELGAQGYVCKSAEGLVLLAAIRAVMRGELALPRLTSSSLPLRAAGGPLTQRQSDVLRMLARGDGNKDIAALLGMAENTLKSHLLRIYRTLGVSTRTAAVRKALDMGLVRDA